MTEAQKSLVDVHRATVWGAILDRVGGTDGERRLSRGDLVNRYGILGALGQGGMSVVYVAYDPELDRRVAIKLLRSELMRKISQAQLLREAQALARLAHPNVVAVHDVGALGERVWLAMELVEGQTLTDWLKQRPRSWRDIIATFCAAGKGLQAAHEVGLVHRDFKPDNVMVGADGRLRVMDFGLAHRGDLQIPDDGAVQGTPAYMAPEQWSSKAPDGCTDQFAFAVALYEALYGQHPFADGPWQEVLLAVLAGRLREPPPGSKVPGWVSRILKRALAVEPAARWSAMADLLAALGHEPRRLPIRIAALVGLIGVALAGGYAAALSRSSSEEQCFGAVQELAGVWDSNTRADLARAFSATGAPFADDVLRRVDSRLDVYADTWVVERTRACEANVAGQQTDHLLDIRVACLTRHRWRLVALLEIFRAADRSVVENAVQAVAALPSVATCADAETLLLVPPPSDPQMVKQVDQLRQQLAQIEALDKTGRFEQGLEQALKLRHEAAGLGYAPLDAEVALNEGNLLMATGRFVEAEAALERAVTLAIVHDLHELGGEAAAKRIYVLSQGLFKLSEALAVRSMAEALVERAHDDGRLNGLLHNNLGVLHTLLGEYATAQEHYERAEALLRSRPGAPEPLLAATYHNLGELSVKQGRLVIARQKYMQAREHFTLILGEKHPIIAHPIAGLGDLDATTGDYDGAVRNYSEALALMEAAHGVEHPYLLQPLVGLGSVYAKRGQVAQARTKYERVVAIADRLGQTDAYVGQALEGLGELTAAGEPARARALFERAALIQASAGSTDSGASAALRAGEVAAQLGDVTAAIAWFERVRALPVDATETVRPAATIRLAAQLAKLPEMTARVCELLAEARPLLAATDPLHAEAEVLRVSRCGEHSG